MRYLTPLILFAGAAYVCWYNLNHTGVVLAFPRIDYLYPPAADSAELKWKASAALLAGLGLVSLAWHLSFEWRYRRRLRGAFEEQRREGGR